MQQLEAGIKVDSGVGEGYTQQRVTFDEEELGTSVAANKVDVYSVSSAVPGAERRWGSHDGGFFVRVWEWGGVVDDFVFEAEVSDKVFFYLNRGLDSQSRMGMRWIVDSGAEKVLRGRRGVGNGFAVDDAEVVEGLTNQGSSQTGETGETVVYADCGLIESSV